MAEVPGSAKAFAGRWRIAEWTSAEFSGKRDNENAPACGRGSGFVCARG